ncbi:MAG: CDP-alcohol phosphatidyltransferase family protein [Thermoplasmata archaeon]
MFVLKGEKVVVENSLGWWSDVRGVILIGPSEEKGAYTRVGGVSVIERTLLSMSQCDFSEATILSQHVRRAKRKLGDTSRLRMKVSHREMHLEGRAATALLRSALSEEALLLVMGDYLLDPRIIEAAAASERRNLVCVDKGSSPQSVGELTVCEVHEGRVVKIGPDLETFNRTWVGVARLDQSVLHEIQGSGRGDVAWIYDLLNSLADKNDLRALDLGEVPGYVPKVRRATKPYWLRIEGPENEKTAKKLLVAAASKEASDLLAKYVHTPLENRIVYHLSDIPITPNQITVVTNVVAYAATILFLLGHLLPASALTFVVGVVDGLDGKLARVRQSVSRVGSLEHPFDFLFEESWILALALYLHWDSRDSLPMILAVLIVLLTAFYRSIYDRFGRSAGRSLDDAGSFERAFRRVAGRRNLYSIHILGGILLGTPLYSLWSILIHASLTAFVYSSRAFVHLRRLDLQR